MSCPSTFLLAIVNTLLFFNLLETVSEKLKKEMSLASSVTVVETPEIIYPFQHTTNMQQTTLETCGQKYRKSV